MCTAAAAALCVPWLRRWRHLPRRNNASSSSLLPFPAGTDRSSPSSNSIPLHSPCPPPCLLDTFFHRLHRRRRRRRRRSLRSTTFNYVPRTYIRAFREKKEENKRKEGKGSWGESLTHAFLDTDRNFSETRSGRRQPAATSPREISADASRNETIQLSSPLPCLLCCSLFNPTHSFFPCRFGISDLCRPCCFRSVPSSSLSFPPWPAPGPPRVPLRRTQVLRAFGQTETRAAP